MLMSVELSHLYVLQETIEVGVFHDLYIRIRTILFDYSVLWEPIETQPILLLHHKNFSKEVHKQGSRNSLLDDSVINYFLVHLLLLVVNKHFSKIECSFVRDRKSVV